MSVLDKLKNMLKGHESQVDKGVDKAGDKVDDRTQGKYTGQVDTAQDKLKGQYGSGGTSGTGQPPGPPQS